jgi:hypothetical protein
VSTKDLVQQRRILADPGDHAATIENATLVKSQRGNVSVVLALGNPDTGHLFDVRPLWIDGPNAAAGTMAARNLAIIGDLLEAVGVAPDSYNAIDNKLLASLVGKTFDIHRSLEYGQTGQVFNAIALINGLIEDADVVHLRTSPAV